jgi:alkylation response protein AidB-like acyl-CoA dehydrogenase
MRDGAATPEHDFALAGLAEDLAALAARHGAEGDRLRQLPPALAEAFVARDVYRLLVPADLGGAGVDPLDFLELVERVSRADGAVGWNLMIGAGSGLYLGYVAQDRAQTMCATAECCIAGTLQPVGHAVAVEGGFRIGGRWGWASGAAQARWMIAGFVLADATGPILDAQGRPSVWQALAPRDAFRVLDTWFTGGLRGTGSTEYEAADLFVPRDAAFQLFASTPTHPAPLFRMPGAFLAAALASVPLGIAQGCADGLKRLAGRKRVLSGRAGLDEQAFAQYAVAKAEALAQSSGLYLRQAIGDIWQTVRRGGPVEMAARARCRRAAVHAAEASAEAVDLCCRAAGGHALFETEPFERALRDVRAAQGHISLQRGAMEDAGRAAFGLPPLSPIF